MRMHARRSAVACSVRGPSSSGGREQRQQDSVAHLSASAPRSAANPGLRWPGPPVIGGRLTAGATRRTVSRTGRSCLLNETPGPVARLSVFGCLAVFGATSTSAVGFNGTYRQQLHAVVHLAQTRGMSTLRIEQRAGTAPRPGKKVLACGERRASNPSIERTFQRPLRALWPAAHVKR